MKKLFKMIKVLDGFFVCRERNNTDDENITNSNFGIGADARRDDRGKGYKQHIKKVWNCRRTDKKVLLVIQKGGEIHLFLLQHFLRGQRGIVKVLFF